MAQRPLEPGEPGRMSISREVQQADGSWKRQDGKAANGVKTRWRARQKARALDGREATWQAYGRTKDEADQALTKKVEAFIAPPVEVVAPAITLRELATMYLDERKAGRDAGNVAYNSVRTYERSWLRHLDESLGSIVITSVTKGMLSKRLTSINYEVGNGAAKSCRSVLVGMFKLAVNNDLIKESPAADISLPASKRRIVNALSPARVEQLRRFIWDKRRGVKDEIKLLIEFQLATGARIGEACGLMWEHIDWDEEKLFIVHTVVRKGDDGLSLDEPKTLTSERTIRMTRRIQRLLRERQEQVGDDPMVFRAPLGGLMDPSNSQYQCRVVMRAMKADTGDKRWLDVTSHTLRRTAGTLLLSAGMPINQVADFLGHGDVSTTLKHYVGRDLESGSLLAAQILDWEDTTDSDRIDEAEAEELAEVEAMEAEELV